MAAEEGGSLPCPFAGQQRANRIDEPSPGTHQLGGDVEQPRLHSRQSLQPLGSKPPASLGIAPPGSASGAGRVDQHEVAAGPQLGQRRAQGDERRAPLVAHGVALLDQRRGDVEVVPLTAAGHRDTAGHPREPRQAVQLGLGVRAVEIRDGDTRAVTEGCHRR